MPIIPQLNKVIEEGDANALRTLLSNTPINLNEPNCHYTSKTVQCNCLPLFKALKSNINVEVVKILIEHGANFHVLYGRDSGSLLSWAIFYFCAALEKKDHQQVEKFGQLIHLFVKKGASLEEHLVKEEVSRLNSEGKKKLISYLPNTGKLPWIIFCKSAFTETTEKNKANHQWLGLVISLILDNNYKTIALYKFYAALDETGRDNLVVAITQALIKQSNENHSNLNSKWQQLRDILEIHQYVTLAESALVAGDLIKLIRNLNKIQNLLVVDFGKVFGLQLPLVGLNLLKFTDSVVKGVFSPLQKAKLLGENHARLAAWIAEQPSDHALDRRGSNVFFHAIMAKLKEKHLRKNVDHFANVLVELISENKLLVEKIYFPAMPDQNKVKLVHVIMEKLVLKNNIEQGEWEIDVKLFSPIFLQYDIEQKMIWLKSLVNKKFPLHQKTALKPALMSFYVKNPTLESEKMLNFYITHSIVKLYPEDEPDLSYSKDFIEVFMEQMQQRIKDQKVIDCAMLEKILEVASDEQVIAISKILSAIKKSSSQEQAIQGYLQLLERKYTSHNHRVNYYLASARFLLSSPDEDKAVLASYLEAFIKDGNNTLAAIVEKANEALSFANMTHSGEDFKRAITLAFYSNNKMLINAILQLQWVKENSGIKNYAEWCLGSLNGNKNSQLLLAQAGELLTIFELAKKAMQDQWTFIGYRPRVRRALVLLALFLLMTNKEDAARSWCLDKGQLNKMRNEAFEFIERCKENRKKKKHSYEGLATAILQWVEDPAIKKISLSAHGAIGCILHKTHKDKSDEDKGHRTNFLHGLAEGLDLSEEKITSLKEQYYACYKKEKSFTSSSQQEKVNSLLRAQGSLNPDFINREINLLLDAKEEVNVFIPQHMNSTFQEIEKLQQKIARNITLPMTRFNNNPDKFASIYPRLAQLEAKTVASDSTSLISIQLAEMPKPTVDLLDFTKVDAEGWEVFCKQDQVLSEAVTPEIASIDSTEIFEQATVENISMPENVKPTVELMKVEPEKTSLREDFSAASTPSNLYSLRKDRTSKKSTSKKKVIVF